MTSDDIFSLLDKKREELGMTKADLGQIAFGNAKDTSLQNIRRGSMPSFTRVARLAEVLGLELYFGPTRLPQTAISDVAPSFRKSIHDDFAFVQRFDVKLSAGPGTNGDNARPLAPVAFRKEWLYQQGLIADSCVVCGVTGDSMEPLLFNTDLVLIDRRVTDLRDGQVYAVTDLAGDIRIKRLEKIEGGILLRSDNPSSPTEARMGEDANRIDIIGRLAWSGHTYENGNLPHSAVTRSG
jgi:hypothetical protein